MSQSATTTRVPQSPDHGLTASPRRLFWNPVLDQSTAKDYSPGYPGPLLAEGPFGVVNLVSSLCLDDYHRIAIDVDYSGVGYLIDCQNDVSLDIAAMCEDVHPFFVWQRSTTNWHLYVPNIAWRWEQYLELLDLLTSSKVVEDAYVKHSIERGQTLLRLPGVAKVVA